ncbi:MAG: DUF86 domain-containing protein [Methylocystis sp.]
MTGKTPFALIGHMVDSAELAVSFLEGMEKEDFLDDIRTQQAVILNLLVIGEMAARLAREHPDFWKRHPEAPWRKMTAMRNRIAHGYFELNLDTVWETARMALPELIRGLKPLRDELAAQADLRPPSPSGGN